MNITPPVLSPRLAEAARLVGKCNCFADIGIDHAYLPIYLLMTGACKTAVASDIGEGPLKRASAAAQKYNQTVSLRLGSGLSTLERDEADAVVIAGMGGLLIADILKSGADKLGAAKKIVLQPMTAVPELRKFLADYGWRIESESIVKEGEKLYILMSVKMPPPDSSFSEQYSEAELFIGKRLAETRPQYFGEYVSKLRHKLNVIIKGLETSKSDGSAEKLEHCQRLLEEVNKLC